MGIVLFYSALALIVYGIYKIRQMVLKQIERAADEEPFPGAVYYSLGPEVDFAWAGSYPEA